MRIRPLENPKMLCHAQNYARRGLHVFPVYESVAGACSCGNPDCENVGKHPRTENGLNNATANGLQILKWWRQWPNANIGINCNGMIVVDVDAKKGGYISLEKLETDLGKLPDTWICDTGGGGKHYFFRRNGINVKNATALRLGVDLKTDGGYVVAAPALHASGKRYRWATESGRELADFPKEWLPLLNGGTSEGKPRFDTAGALAGVPEGKRDDTCWRLACKLRNADVPYDMALSLVLEAAAKCTPNFSADIAREKVERAYRQYGPKKADERPPHPADDYPGSEGDYSTESDYEQPGPQSWETPSPFYETDLPEFPVQALPAAVGEYVSAIATATQTPVDLAGMLALSVLAASCSKKVKVQIRPGFVEPVNLYTVTAIASANRKSAVYKAMLEPLESYEAAECKRTAADIARQTARYKILEKSYQRAQEAAAKASGPEKREMLTQEAEELAAELALMRVPFPPRLLADDCSPERLASLLERHGGRMALMSAEGDLFEIMAGRYSPNTAPNLGVFLKGHNGDELRVDRVGRPAEFVREPAITIGLTVQPEVIDGLAGKPGFRGKGLLARFLYSMPPSILGNRKANPPVVPEEITHQYVNTVTKLLELPLRVDTDGNAAPHILQMEDRARTTIIIFMGFLEPKLAPLGELGFISDWAGKLTGGVSRIAGLIHMAQNADGNHPWEVPITDQTVNDAIVIGEYLIPHARAAFGAMGADPAIEAAKYILAWIKKKDLKEFTKREAFNGCRGKFRRATELDAPLALLTEQGYIRERAAGSDSGPGRKPSQIYEVNPNCA